MAERQVARACWHVPPPPYENAMAGCAEASRLSKNPHIAGVEPLRQIGQRFSAFAIECMRRPFLLATQRLDRSPTCDAQGPKARDQSHTAIHRPQLPQPIESSVHLCDLEASRTKTCPITGGVAGAAVAFVYLGLRQLVCPFYCMKGPMSPRLPGATRPRQSVQRRECLDERLANLLRIPLRRDRIAISIERTFKSIELQIELHD